VDVTEVAAVRENVGVSVSLDELDGVLVRLPEPEDVVVLAGDRVAVAVVEAELPNVTLSVEDAVLEAVKLAVAELDGVPLELSEDV